MLEIATFMTTAVISVKPETPIAEALDLLVDNQISGLPVINDQEEVVGVLSEKDVLTLLLDKKLDIKSTVQDYMSTNIITFTEKDSAMDVCKFFMQNNIRRVPIVRDKKLVGIVSRHDIVALIVDIKKKMAEFRYT